METRSISFGAVAPIKGTPQELKQVYEAFSKNIKKTNIPFQTVYTDSGWRAFDEVTAAESEILGLKDSDGYKVVKEHTKMPAMQTVLYTTEGDALALNKYYADSSKYYEQKNGVDKKSNWTLPNLRDYIEVPNEFPSMTEVPSVQKNITSSTPIESPDVILGPSAMSASEILTAIKANLFDLRKLCFKVNPWD